jgi:hypothetical protein
VLKRLQRGRTSTSTAGGGAASDCASSSVGAAESGSRRLRTVLRFLCSGLAGLGLVVLLVTVTQLVSWWAGFVAGPWSSLVRGRIPTAMS